MQQLVKSTICTMWVTQYWKTPWSKKNRCFVCVYHPLVLKCSDVFISNDNNDLHVVTIFSLPVISYLLKRCILLFPIYQWKTNSNFTGNCSSWQVTKTTCFPNTAPFTFTMLHTRQCGDCLNLVA